MKRLVVLCLSVALVTLWASPLRSASAAQLVTNGGFESGSTGWQQSSANGYPLVDSSLPHSGAYSAWLCGYNACDDRIQQTVTLPASFSSVTLTFWSYVSTQEASTACYDSLSVQIRTAAGTTIAPGTTLCNSTAPGWAQRTLDVTPWLNAYKGQSVQVFFRGTTNAAAPSSFFVDDVALNTVSTTTVPTATSVPNPTATSAPRPTATSTPRPTATSASAPTPTKVSTSVPTSGQCVDASTQAACIQYMLNKLNSDRSQNGVAPLTLNSTQTNGTSSCVGSYGHSVHMAQMGQISHDQFPADICIPYTTAGENVGMASMGSETTDLNTMDSQMMAEPHSPGCSGNHACNILNPSFHQVGIGIYRSGTTTWLTEDFTN